MTTEISKQFYEMLSPQGEEMFGATVLGISQENMNDAVSNAKKNGWDKNTAIEKGKEIFGTMFKKTKEIVKLLYVAKVMLAEDKKSKEPKYDMTFDDFCESIGIIKSTANRWIKEWKDPEGTKKSKDKGIETKEDNIIRKNAGKTFNSLGISILEENDNSIVIEVNYMGQIFERTLERK